jgi:GT2 family glycosyltransferase
VTKIGIVVIGRNEGQRLVRCLGSIDGAYETVYVDSGSTDGSVATALESNARVVELDMTRPFTAARARNAGRSALSAECTFVQFIDGDCVLQPGWLDTARTALRDDSTLAAVFGRRREVAPETSLFNWLCDLEWAVPSGPANYFGGDVMIRARALDRAGGYPSEMIAGEEPDLSLRLRKAGWTIACLPAEMTLHDAALTQFGQWWRRTVRSGHAYAELAWRHRRSFSDYGSRASSVLFWGVCVPLVTLAALLAGLVAKTAAIMLLAAGFFSLLILQIARLTWRECKNRSFSEAAIIATFLMLGKPAQALGIGKYWLTRLRGKRSTLIEYKTQAT